MRIITSSNRRHLFSLEITWRVWLRRITAFSGRQSAREWNERINPSCLSHHRSLFCGRFAFGFVFGFGFGFVFGFVFGFIGGFYQKVGARRDDRGPGLEFQGPKPAPGVDILDC